MCAESVSPVASPDCSTRFMCASTLKSPVPFGVTDISPFVTVPVIVDAVDENSVTPILTFPVPCEVISKVEFEVSF